MGAVNMSDPQSWNRYAYVGNNPLATTDPTGLLTEGASGGILAALCSNPVTCIIGGILEGILDFFTFFHHHVPHAPAAPAGGYGGGIDPFGNSIFQQVHLNVGWQIPCVSSGIPGGVFGVKHAATLELLLWGGIRKMPRRIIGKRHYY